MEFPKTAEAVDTWQISEKFDEELYLPMGDEFHFWMRDNNTHFWLPNRHRPDQENKRKYSFDPKDGIQRAEITPESMQEEVQEFTDQFQDAIALLRREYGEENVSIKWGLIHYIS